MHIIQWHPKVRDEKPRNFFPGSGHGKLAKSAHRKELEKSLGIKD